MKGNFKTHENLAVRVGSFNPFHVLRGRSCGIRALESGSKIISPRAINGDRSGRGSESWDTKYLEKSSVQVAITCRHGDIAEELRDYITQKAEKLLNYFERVTAIEVTVDFEGDRVTAEIIVDAEHKHDFVASDSGDEVRATFDRTLHKMEQQIRRYKEKLQDHRRDKPIAQLSEAEATEQEQLEE